MIAKQKVNPYLSSREIPSGYLNIMDINCSEVNGPGSRAVVWLQKNMYSLNVYNTHS